MSGLNGPDVTPDRAESFFALSAAEWRNLLALGQLRLLKTRVVSGNVRADPYLQRLVFVRSPHGNLEDSADYRVVELHSGWSDAVRDHPHDDDKTTIVIAMDVVKATFPSMEKDRVLLEEEAAPLGVSVGGAEFAESWEEWMVAEGVHLGILAGREVASFLGLLEKDGDFPFNSEEAVRVILGRPANAGSETLAALDKFVKSKQTIEHKVAGDRDSAAFPIVCVYEWIYSVTRVDMLKDCQPLADELRSAHDSHKGQPWDRARPIDEPTRDLFEKIRAMFPDAFSGPLLPAFAPLLLAYSEELRLERCEPHDLPAEFARVAAEEGVEMAQLLALFLGVEIGLERARQLRLLSRV